MWSRQHLPRAVIVAATLFPFAMTPLAAAPALKGHAPERPKTAPPPAPGVAADKVTQHLLQQTVAGQLAAFNKGDYVTAFRFAAAPFHKMYTPVKFRNMVMLGFPQIASSRKAIYGPARRFGVNAMMPVTVIGSDGVRVAYLYTLTREGGGWRVINVDPAPKAPPAKKPDSRAV